MRNNFVLILIYLAAGAVITSCDTQSGKLSMFTQMPSGYTGIKFQNTLIENERDNILTYEYFYNGGAVAAGDINNDGLVDLYFTANQGENKLYLNKGNFQFEDITAHAGVSAANGWRTGVSMADVNGDGLLDIYVCRSGDLHPLFRTNLLFINNGDLTFSERAAEYGLDDDSYSTQGAWFDYDRDGDLDLFLLNHSRLTISNAYDISKRYTGNRVRYVGNELYRNDNGKFKKVGDETGIFGPASNYGLGIAFSDLNNDGWADIYITNDYTEKDKVFINQHGKYFLEVSDSLLTHMSQFSMGVDIGDINNDGWADIITLDMLPDVNERQKEFYWPDRYDVYTAMVRSGLHHQYMRNMLHLNNGDGTFSEIGQFSGISNTDWSWASLIADFDNDGLQDLFVSNGFKRNFTSNDFLRYKADRAVKARNGIPSETLQEVLSKMPSNAVHNFMFRNTTGIAFADVSTPWGFSEETLTHGVVYADLDNDGDLDLVVNNTDREAGIYRNNAEQFGPANFIKVMLQGNNSNTFGVGAKVMVYSEGVVRQRELYPQKGFQSSVEPALFFGLGKATYVDSVVILWPTGEREVQTNIPVNSVLQFKQENAVSRDYRATSVTPFFKEEKEILPFVHQENDFVDFKIQGLLPRSYSTLGPAAAMADINGDGRQDIFIGGAKGQPAKIFVQKKNGGFSELSVPAFMEDRHAEDIDALFFDMDHDGDDDLYVVSGGYEFSADDPVLQDRLYRNEGNGKFVKATLPPLLSSGSCVRKADIDGDGDVDLFVGGRLVPGRYPEIPLSGILLNDGKGTFTLETEKICEALIRPGMVTDAHWLDLNADGLPDLVVAGEWMPLKFFINYNGVLKDESAKYLKPKSEGWWNVLKVCDIDNDGDADIVVGNFGQNNQFKPTIEKPVTVHYSDFDDNGSVEPILEYFIGERSYPLPTRDELTDQLPVMKKRFPDYKDYTRATVETMFTSAERMRAAKRQAFTFESSVLVNKGGGFELLPLPAEAQFAPVFAIAVMDIDGDGKNDLITGGNLSKMGARFGKAVGSFGTVLLNRGGSFQYIPSRQSGLTVRGDVRKFLQDRNDLYVILNNDSPVRYRLIQ